MNRCFGSGELLVSISSMNVVRAFPLVDSRRDESDSMNVFTKDLEIVRIAAQPNLCSSAIVELEMSIPLDKSHQLDQEWKGGMIKLEGEEPSLS